MFGLFRKPKWQHRDPQVRLEAVKHATAAELLQALPEILRSDSEREVRLAAFERLGERVAFVRLLEDSDEVLRQRAQARLFKELLANDQHLSHLPKLAPESIERIAREASMASVRKAALERCNRVGLFADSALNDPDGELRLSMIERIEVGPALKRVIEQSRRRDKRVYRAALAKQEQAELNQGKEQASEQQLDGLVRRLEQLLRGLPEHTLEEVQAVEQRWQQLASGERDPQHPAVRLAAKFFGLLSTVRSSFTASRAERVTAPVVTEVAPAVSEVLNVPQIADQELQTLLANLRALTHASYEQLDACKASFEARFKSLPETVEHHRIRAELIAELANRKAILRAEEDARHAAYEHFKRDLADLYHALEAGDSKAARLHLEAATRFESEHAKWLKPEEAKKLESLKLRFSKLDGIKRWANNQARAELCKEAEALPSQSLHPDALAQRVKDLRNAWAKLDASDGMSEEQAKTHGLSRRFRALLGIAMKPARSFFEKRDEVRGKKTQAVAELLKEAEQLLGDSNSPATALVALRGNLSEALRNLDQGDPAKRKALGEQIKATLVRLRSSVDQRFGSAREEKSKLIAQLRFKLKHAPREEAVDLIKAAQARYKQMARAGRADEDKLWQELKALSDPVFAALKQSREEESAQAKALEQEQDQLLGELEQLVEHAKTHPGDAEARLEGLDSRFRAFEEVARHRQRRFDQLVEQLHGAARSVQERNKLARLDALRRKSLTISAWEAARADGEASDLEQLRASYQELPELDPNFETAMRRRLEALSSSEAQNESQDKSRIEQAQALVLLLEWLAGVDSPAEYAGARQQLALDRLKLKMSGMEIERTREIEQTLIAWYCLGALPEHHRTMLQARVDRVESR